MLENKTVSMKSQLNQRSDLELWRKITAKTSLDSQNKKAWIEHARQYEHSEHRKVHITRKSNPWRHRGKRLQASSWQCSALRLYTGLPSFEKGRLSQHYHENACIHLRSQHDVLQQQTVFPFSGFKQHAYKERMWLAW